MKGCRICLGKAKQDFKGTLHNYIRANSNRAFSRFGFMVGLAICLSRTFRNPGREFSLRIVSAGIQAVVCFVR